MALGRLLRSSFCWEPSGKRPEGAHRRPLSADPLPNAIKERAEGAHPWELCTSALAAGAELFLYQSSSLRSDRGGGGATSAFRAPRGRRSGVFGCFGIGGRMPSGILGNWRQNSGVWYAKNKWFGISGRRNPRSNFPIKGIVGTKPPNLDGVPEKMAKKGVWDDEKGGFGIEGIPRRWQRAARALGRGHPRLLGVRGASTR